MFSAAIKTAAAAGGYQISRSLRFNSADSAYLARTFANTGNQKTWTWSGWLKLSAFGALSTFFERRSGASDATIMSLLIGDGSFGTTKDALVVARYSFYNLITTQLFRDPSAWYHIVLNVDTTQATSSNRMKLYVNGQQITAFSSSTYPSLNEDLPINAAAAHDIGKANYFNGYMTEINFIDGQALTPSSFGQTNAQTGVWEPVAYSGSYGTNGFYLNFSDNSNTTAATLGKDYSGNGNNWTPNNFSVAAGAGNDSLVDSPTSYGTDTGAGGSVRGNYPTWNPLKRFNFNVTLSNGNLDTSVTQTSSTEVAVANMALPTTGKWYWEVTLQTYTNASADVFLGVCTTANATQNTASTVTSGGGYYRGNGAIYNLSNSAQTSGGTWSQGDVIGIAVDVGAGTVQFYRNNVAQGATPSFSFTAGTELVPYIANDNSANAKVTNLNFGQRPFAYTAPSGFKALCTQNLPTPAIGATSTTQAGKYFNAVLYTGNGSTQSITGVGFQPDMVWIKQRSQVRNHNVYDAVRGVLKVLQPNVTDVEVNYSNSLTSFDSDGFSLGNASDPNTNTGTYVAWNWKANGAGSSNTAGSITSTVSANTTSGFSVVTYTGNGTNGATVGHGLGVAPSFFVVKERNGSSSWVVYTAVTGNTQFLVLNNTDSAQTASTLWNNTSPTSTVFTVGTSGAVNTNTSTYVAYCFAEVPGYSRFGSYVGGSSVKPFVYCGFRPAYIMIKYASGVSSASWVVWDNKRNTYNAANSILTPNTSNAEFTGSVVDIDFLSNGFCVRGTDGSFNDPGVTYIFAAFAESPFKFALAR